MAILKTEILAAVNAALSRAETNIDAAIKGIVTDIARRKNVLEKAEPIATAAGTPGYALPTDFKATIALEMTGEKPLKHMTWQDYQERLAGNGSNEQPRRYAVRDGKLYLWPTPDGGYAVTLRYWANHLPATGGDADPILYPETLRTAVLEGVTAKVALGKQLYDDFQIHQSLYEAELEKIHEHNEVRFTRHNDL